MPFMKSQATRARNANCCMARRIRFPGERGSIFLVVTICSVRPRADTRPLKDSFRGDDRFGMIVGDPKNSAARRCNRRAQGQTGPKRRNAMKQAVVPVPFRYVA